MISTYKLYYDNPYLCEFHAIIIKLNDNEAILNKTAFYPQSGGQAADTGVIGEYRVVDTKKLNSQLIHVLETFPDFKINQRVKCKIDWERRYKIMKLHSAAHIMEHFLWQNLGNLKRLGSYVDDKKDRADYSYDGRLPNERLKEIEMSTNKFLTEGHDITIELDASDPSVRIWRCGPIEMPCGGTHVKNTSEIGLIKLKRKNPGKGVERIETSLL